MCTRLRVKDFLTSNGVFDIKLDVYVNLWDHFLKSFTLKCYLGKIDKKMGKFSEQ